MEKINNLYLLSLTLILSACGGGGGSGSSSGGGGSPIVTPTITATLVPVSQVGTSNQFESNNQTYLDFKPYAQDQYFYAYVTNNQNTPLFNILKSGTSILGSGGPGGNFAIESLPSDPQNCDQYTQANPLPVNGTCRALVNGVAADSRLTYGEAGSGNNQFMNYNITFNLGGSAYPCNSCGNNGINAGAGPTIKASFPAQVGLWMIASESNIKIQGMQDNNTFFTASPSGNYLYFDNFTAAYSAPAKYQVTWRADGSPWVDVNNPAQTWPTSVMNPQRSLFYGLQMDGTPDCNNCVPYGQNFDLTPSNPQNAIYNYNQTQWYSLNSWINQDPVSLSFNSVFVSGLDNNEYVNYKDLNSVIHSYKINSSGLLTEINTNGNYILAVAADGTILTYGGCLKTSDNTNYSLTPYNGRLILSPAVPYVLNNQIMVRGQKLDVSSCTLNNFMTGGTISAGYSQTTKQPLSTLKGVFDTYGQNIVYYPYPSSN